MISFKRKIKLALAMMIISMFNINIYAIDQEHSRIAPNYIVPHSEAENSNGVTAKTSNNIVVDKTVAQKDEQVNKEKSISSGNDNKVDNLKKNTSKNETTELSSSQKNTKEKSDETKSNKHNKNQTNTISPNNTKKNRNTNINKEVSSVTDLNDTEQIDNNLENQEEINQEQGGSLSGGFDFIKSNKAQNNWIGDGKILLYIGILFISVSILGIFIILIPKRKKKFKNFLF